MTRILTISFLIFITFTGYSQTYPVQATTTLIPPYSVYLADYVVPGSQRLALNIFLADINRPELNVRIRLRIEGQGIRIETKREYLPQPLILRGGVPERLTTADLAPLFKPENLNFQGITRRQFERNGALPEGLYRFCFEILEYNRGVKISNTACAMAWLILNDPPLINMPRNGEKLKAQNPQYITFQWTPRHTGSPNSAFSTEYEFSLVEIWPENRNPNDAILTSPPIYETTTYSTTLIYGPGEPPLIPGRHYAFRVRAKSMVGIDEVDLFKNDGYSQVYSFIYGDACHVPENIAASVLSSTRFKMEWNPLFNHTEFTVHYREANEENGEWIAEGTYLDEFEVNSLKPGTTYEYQIAAGCTSIAGAFSEIATITTSARSETAFVCGADAADFDLDNKELIESLVPGDYIYSGDFEIKLDSVSGTKGVFAGGGKVVIPFLNFVKVRTVFENITVNTDYRVIEGNVYTYWDPNSKLMYDGPKRDSIKAVEEGIDGLGEISGIQTDSAEQNALDTMAITSNETAAAITTEGDTVDIDQAENIALSAPSESESNSGEMGSGTSVEVDEGGGGNGTGGVDGGSVNATAAIADADVTFGPLSIKFSEPPQSTGMDEEGYCIFEGVKASFILNLKGQYEISKQVTIENATVSFKKQCESNEYKDVAVNWNHPPGVALGKIYFIEATLRQINLEIDGDGNLRGSLGLHAALAEDQVVDDIIKIKKGMNGDFSFHYGGANDFSGLFDFEGVKDVNIDLVKDNQTIGSLKDGILNKEGMLTGDVTAQEGGVVNYKSNGLTLTVDKFNANITYSVFQGVEINTGNGQFTLSDIDGLDGSLKISLGINQDIFTTSIVTSKLSGYGLTFSKLNIRADMSKTFDLGDIKGSFMVKHKDFSNGITIQDFQISGGKLTQFSGNGQITYQDLTLNLTNTSYDPQSGDIIIDANVEVQHGDMNIAASVEDFTINRQGDITFGGYNTNVSGTLYFGPVTVALTGNVDDRGEKVEKRYREYSADASFYLKMKGAKGVEKEVAIANGKLTYIKHKNEDLFRQASLYIEDVDIPVGEVYGIDAAIQNFNIHIASNGEFSAFNDHNQSGVFIENESYVTLGVSLYEDKVVNDLVKIKKGLEGQIVFNFEKGEEYKGSFDLGGIKNLNLLVEKNGSEIAALKNGSFDKDGNLEGKLIGIQGTSYKSGGFDITVDKLELGVGLNLHDGWRSLKIASGNGKFSVSNITGLQGELKIGMAYGVDGNFNATLLSKESEITAFGMKLQDLNLEAEFTESLDLEAITGSVKAAHSDFDAALTVSKFKVESGELKVWEANGAINYKNFNFELSKSSYVNQKLSISAKVEIEDAGKLAVSKFEIDKDGKISIGEISGELNKPMVDMAFDATFKESGFKGSFTGGVKFIKLEGDIDFGTQDSFNYGYLRMVADSRSGIALGATGLQLTRVGGQLGYNYYLDFNAGKFTGGPKQYNYLVGLTLGISDVANMFAAEGTTVVQFGNDKLQLNLMGSIKAPRSNPMIESNFNVNYYLPDNTIDGSMQLDIAIPRRSGLVFNTNANTGATFSYAKQNWNVDANLYASMFRVVQFEGNAEFRRTRTSIYAHLSGRASYDFKYDIAFERSWASISAGIEAHFNSSVSATLDNTGFSGAIGVSCSGMAYLDFEVLGINPDPIQVSASGEAELSYANGQGNIEGMLKSSFSIYGISRQTDFPVKLSF
ncbi:MAG: fibronectin type III domain-containing protein [Fulvivirga sp.]